MGSFVAALILVGGSLGDVFGERRVFSVGVLGFGLSSLGPLVGGQLIERAPHPAVCRLTRAGRGSFVTPGEPAH
jgi:hypothetical protein